jgi:hypothetical protein
MPFWDPLRGDSRFEKLLEDAKQLVSLNASASGVPGRGNVTPPPEKSIAVLPFENLSRDPENAFFTDGRPRRNLNRLGQDRGLESNQSNISYPIHEPRET